MNKCIDAGREGCPCQLAESGNCLVCGRLNGQSCDDCGWQGTCIYTLYRQNGRRLIRERSERIFDIVDVRDYRSDFKVFVLHADRGYCQKASTVGSYVFVKGVDDNSWFELPISILKSEPDKERIHLGVCACGPKSKKLLAQDSRLSVRGVYDNGLSGLQGLAPNPVKTLVFVKGIAMAPLRNFLDGGERYVKYLKNLKLYVDPDKVDFDFFKDYFGDLPAASIEVRNFAKEGLCSLQELEQDPADINVFALTSPYYANQIQQAAGENRTIVRPTEGSFCCGEGVCGACTFVDEDGRTIRRCKSIE